MDPSDTKGLQTRSESLDASIETRLVADLYYHAKGVLVGTLVLYVINLAFYLPVLPATVMIPWSMLMLSSCLIRGLSYRRYNLVQGAGQARRWHREVVFAYVVMALGWGLLGLSSVLLLAPTEALVAIVTVAGITGSAAATSSASPVVFKSVAYIGLGPLAIALLLSDHAAFPYVGAMSACYLIVLRRASARIHETLRQSVTFGLKNEDLVQMLALQSTVDSLTGLSNRRALNQGFEDAWANGVQQSRSVGLILCDIDHFKQYNDTHGHLEGDRCLRKVAQVLLSVTRDSDLLTARYGGEEFAVLLPDCANDELERISERLREAVLALQIAHGGDGASEYVTLSVGASHCVPLPNLAIDDLIRAADSALYQAKAAGRNRVQVDHRPELLQPVAL